ncbi:small peptidoglycan-associated lipoprotein [Neobacillus sp. PS3-34]|uniref:small peptidoglycan-associated lipoprotein n=1 Tax=Neobacillus sp. PS3-34 TaxID=3070678 RepID=UPI0027E1EA3C|nr:small peptidoglycan-associated lipoprotein [Neobacillus sp. PS3-34]WML49404.1 small peptidoglycan-associated lipoprotein [Neobacillus sp. PS3-34]
MKGLPYIFIFSLLLLSASCNNNQASKKMAFNRNVKQVIFFSDEKELGQEAAYYDALIELKKNFPKEMDHMMVLNKSKEKDYYKSFNVEKSPAIIVMYKDQMMVKINGSASKNQIIKNVSQIIK